MASKNTKSGLSLDELGDFFGMQSEPDCAEWYHQPNTSIPIPAGGHFDRAHPDGKHPVLLLDCVIRRTDSPTQTYPCWVRSASVPSKIQHNKHSHGAKTCRLNAMGWIVLESSFPVFKEDLLDHFCDEPLDSSLVKALRKHSRTIALQLGGAP